MRSDNYSNTAVRISLLGGFSLIVRGDRRQLPTKKAEALVAYLSCHLEEQVSRRTIASLIWPANTPKEARHSLNQAVYSIRQIIPELTISGNREYLSLAATGTLVDYFVFQDCLRRRLLVDAENCFAGPFLDGVQFNVAEEFDDWVDEMRGTVSHLAMRMLEDLIGQPSGTLSDSHRDRIVKKLLKIDPDNSAAKTALFLPSHAPGNAAEDLRSVAGAHLFNGRLPFKGRDREFNLALRQLSSAINSLQLTVVTGAAGAGKSRFADQVMRAAALRGMKVYSVGSDPDGVVVPFATIRSLLSVVEEDLLESSTAKVPMQFQSLRELSASDDRVSSLHSISGQLQRALTMLSELGPTLVCVDDYQWVDRASRHAVLHCIRNLRGCPVVFIISSRSEQKRYRTRVAQLCHAVDVSAIQRIVLGRLDDEDVEALLLEQARRTGVAISHELCDEIVRTTKGHPLFLSETVAALSSSAFRSFDSLSVRDSLGNLLKARFRALPIGSRHCLKCMASIGRRADSFLIARVSGIAHTDAVSALRMASKSGLIEKAGSQWGFTHETVRQVVYSGMKQKTKELFHRRIVAVLRAAGENGARIAVHAARAGDRASAYAYALEAAEEVQPLEWLGGADHLFRLAVDNASNDNERFVANWKLATYLMLAHRFPSAQQAWSECANLAPPSSLPSAQLGVTLARISRSAERADRPAVELLDMSGECLAETSMLLRLAGSAIVACSCIGNVALDQGRTDVLTRLVDVLQVLAEHAPEHGERSAAAGLMATLLCHVGRVNESDAWSKKAIAEAEVNNDNLALIRAHVARGACLMFDGRSREAMVVIAGCRDRAKLAGLRELHATSVLNYIVSILDAGELHLVDEVVEEVRDQLAAEWRHRQIYVYLNLCFIRYEQGAFREAERLANQALVENEILGSECIHKNAWGVIGLCSLERHDRVVTQRAYGEVSREMDIILGTADCTYPLLFLGRYWEGNGNTTKAINQVSAAVEYTRNRYRTCWALLQTELARLCMRSERNESIRLLGELEDWAATRGCGLVLAHVYRARRGIRHPAS